MSGRITSERRRRVTGLAGRSGLGERQIRVGTFNDGGVSRSIPDGTSESYRIETSTGQVITGKVWGPGGYDELDVEGEIVSKSLGPNLVIHDPEGPSSGGGSEPEPEPTDPGHPVEPVQPRQPVQPTRPVAPRQPRQPRPPARQPQQPHRPSQSQQAGIMSGNMMPVLIGGGILTAGIVTAVALASS